MANSDFGLVPPRGRAGVVLNGHTGYPAAETRHQHAGAIGPMLIKIRILERIREGQVDLLFRRWTAARVKPGTMLKTPLGVVEIISVAPVTEDTVAHADAVRAGYAGTAQLRRELAVRPDGTLFRIEVRWAGEDPRTRLAADTALDGDALTALTDRLDQMDRRDRLGP